MTRETTIMDVKRLILEKMRGIFEKVPEDDETLNEIVQVHIQNNLPMIKTGTYIKERAKCEFAGRKLSYKEDYSELKFDDVDVNESVENASNATIGQILDKMVHKRRLVLAILLKQAGSHFLFNELRCKYRRFSHEEEDMTLEGRIAR